MNVALAAAAALPLFTLGPVLGGLAEPLVTFLYVNVGLALFNLTPAYPMDGGRVLRGLLWSRVGNFKATWWAARAGQGFAVLFGVLGLVANPMLVLIAAFVYFQASAELARLRAARAAGWVPVEDDEPPARVAHPTGVNQPRRWTTSEAWPLHAVAVHTVHTPFGSYREVELSDGRRVRAS